MFGPDPNAIYPNESIRQVVYIKNVITRPNILVGDYTYYDDPDGAERFQEHVTHHYDFIGDRLIIGRFCAIGRGVEFTGWPPPPPIPSTFSAMAGRNARPRRPSFH